MWHHSACAHPIFGLAMPHVIIELPNKVAHDAKVAALLDAVHAAVSATRLFEIENIKTRVITFNHYRIGTTNAPFIHVQCRIHAGRSEPQKKTLSEAVLSAVLAQALPVSVITVEVVEIDRVTYAKYAG